jgi:hypothetical protein
MSTNTTSRTSQQALQDALDSGAVAAFIAGRIIEWRFDREDQPWTVYDMVHQEHIGCWQIPPFAADQFHWRPTPLALPSPPPGESWHNPDNLTPEQVGEGYRLLLVSEVTERNSLSQDIRCWLSGKTRVERWSHCRHQGSSHSNTYRVTTSTPFHWDAPKRIPLAPEDFIGAWLKLSDISHWQVTGVEGVDIHIKRGVYEVDELISREILVRLANTTEFVPCWKEGA